MANGIKSINDKKNNIKSAKDLWTLDHKNIKTIYVSKNIYYDILDLINKETKNDYDLINYQSKQKPIIDLILDKFGYIKDNFILIDDYQPENIQINIQQTKQTSDKYNTL